MSDANEKPKPSCFIIMPISDPPGYADGHCARVYEHLIKPACVAAGYAPLRGDGVQATNYIVLDVLHRIMNSDMVVCDLSGRNPNVLYELGIRQAFDKPVVLVKDKQTERIFDIQGLRTLEYDESLRVDLLTADVEKLEGAIESTAKPAAHDVNSLVKLLGVAAAKVGPKTEISPETSLILDALKEMGARIRALEDQPHTPSPGGLPPPPLSASARNQLMRSMRQPLILPNGQEATVGEKLYAGGTEIGIFAGRTLNGALVLLGPNGQVTMEKNDPIFGQVTTSAF